MGMNRIAEMIAVSVLITSNLYAADIHGVVMSKSRPVPHAHVQVKEKPGAQTFSDDKGEYTIPNVVAGLYTVIATNPRFWPELKDNVSPGDTVNFDMNERSYKSIRGPEGVLLEADVSGEDARKMLDAAKVVGDTQAVLLLSNRLLVESPRNNALKLEARQAKDSLNQTRATIAGAVSDPSGAVVPNAKVTVKNDQTGAITQTRTDANGRYQAQVFPLGSYSVKVEGYGKTIATDKVEDVAPRSTIMRDMHVSPQ